MADRYVIWSIEHFAWWRPGKMGYTPELAEAGIYDKDEAGAIVQNANRVKVNECAIPVESTTRTDPPPANDEDIVLRFRGLYSRIVEALPLEHFRDEKERRSTAVTMMLRATVQELIAHVGANHKALTYVLSEELRRALDDAIDAKKVRAN